MTHTIVDIAREAKVSTATVSRVINNHPHVSPKTRSKVIEVMEKSNYQPDLIARSMVKKRSNNIGLIVGSLSNPFYAETSQLITSVANQYHSHVTLCCTGDDDSPVEQEKFISFLSQRRVDGIIIGSIRRQDEKLLELLKQVPCVLYNKRLDSGHMDYVVLDNKNGAFQAVQHLIEAGHTRIGFLHGPTALSSTSYERYQGYMETMNKYNLSVREEWVHEIHYHRAKKEIPRSIQIMMSSRYKPTAIFATMDWMALIALGFLSDNGYRIPDDIAVVGFDNIDMASLGFIQLTTVEQRKEEMARLAIERLMQKIDNPESANGTFQIVLKPNLVKRNTCGSSRETRWPH